MLYDSIDDKNLNRSLWVLKNVSKIRFFIKFFLSASIIIIYFIFIWNVVLMIQSSNKHVEFYNSFLIDANKNYSSFNSYLKEVSPVNVSVKAQGFSRGYSKVYYDFYALVVNSNEKYKLSSFDYYFVYNGDVKTAVKTEYLPINSEKYVFVRGVSNPEGNIENAQLMVENLKWSLVNLNPKRPTHFVDTKVPFDCEVQENKLVASDEKISNLKDGSASVNVFSFKITNNSLNNYNIIKNKILFFDKSGAVEYVIEKEISKVKAGEYSSTTVNLPSHLQEFGSVLVLPEVDMCSEDSYMTKDIINTGV